MILITQLLNYEIKAAQSSADLNAFLVQANVVLKSYTDLGQDAPEWLGPKIRKATLARDVLKEGENEARLRELKSRRASKMTLAEQREALDNEIALLEGRVIQPVASPPTAVAE